MGRPVLPPGSTALRLGRLTIARIPTPEALDHKSLAMRLRHHDKIEVRAFFPDVPLADALRAGVTLSAGGCWAAHDAAGPLAVWGIAADTERPDVGVPWLLMSDELVTTHRRAFVRHSPSFLAEMSAPYRALVNYVHADNTTTIRWLGRLGFVVTPDRVDVGGQPFRMFYSCAAPPSQ